MYSEIASNKRRSIIFIGLFFVIWVAIGARHRPCCSGRFTIRLPPTAWHRPPDQLRLDSCRRRRGDRWLSWPLGGSSTP